MKTIEKLKKALQLVTGDLEGAIELLNQEVSPNYFRSLKTGQKVLKSVKQDKNLIVIEVGISDSRRKKIAYDLGQYDDDLPDNVECEDWLISLIKDKFDSLPEALKGCEK